MFPFLQNTAGEYTNMAIKYKRILLKISGEALSSNGSGMDMVQLRQLATQIAEVSKLGVEIGIVVGGGNFWRGRVSTDIDRGTADYIGMLATVMNSLALTDMLNSVGVDTHIVSSIMMDKITESYHLPRVLKYLDSGKVVVFAGGCGAPYFSTDTTATLRACEIHADAVLCTKSIDGVYDSDPAVNPQAKKYSHLTYAEVLSSGLKALDLTATAMAWEYKLPLVVFSKDVPNSIIDVVMGKEVGTLIN